MSNRRVSPYLLHGDPVPTNMQELANLIHVLRHVTDTVARANETLRTIGRDTDLWVGPAANAFNDTARELQARVNDAELAYARSLEALQAWERTLVDLQGDAEQVASQANAIGAQVGGARDYLVVHHVPPELEPLQRRRDAIAWTAAQNATTCARAIDDAINIVKRYQRSFFDRIAVVAEEFKTAIGTVSMWVGGATIVLALIPGLQPVAAALVLTGAGLAILNQATTTYLFVRTPDKDWRGFAGDTFWNGISVAVPGSRAGAAAGRASGAMRAVQDAAETEALGALRAAEAARAGSRLEHTMVGVAMHNMDEAGRFGREAAKAERDISIRGFLDGYRDIWKTEARFGQFGDIGQSTSRLQGLDAWLEPGHRGASAAAIGVESLDAAHLGVEIGQARAEAGLQSVDQAPRADPSAGFQTDGNREAR